jgi:hypothetical protein
MARASSSAIVARRKRGGTPIARPGSLSNRPSSRCRHAGSFSAPTSPRGTLPLTESAVPTVPSVARPRTPASPAARSARPGQRVHTAARGSVTPVDAGAMAALASVAHARPAVSQAIASVAFPPQAALRAPGSLPLPPGPTSRPLASVAGPPTAARLPGLFRRVLRDARHRPAKNRHAPATFFSPRALHPGS